MTQNSPTTSPSRLIDSFGREVNYLRMSVTDRCDFRCVYCMAEDMQFLPRDKVLSLEELTTIAKAFRSLGVDKLRMTGGEPLIRRDVIQLFQQIGQLGFKDLSLTTNGSHLDRYAQALVDAGVHRINISLDTLKPERFKHITRVGKLENVLKGIDVAKQAGFKRIKINAVILQNHNADETMDLARYAVDNGLDISFIEEMPLGDITSHNRKEEFISSESLRNELERHFTLTQSTVSTGGPSRYWSVQGSDSRIGFISPHSHNFCETCNRVRVSAEGRLLLCLGNEHSVDLRSVVRSHPEESREEALVTAIKDSMSLKPKQHYFSHDEEPQILRFMNATGG